MQGRELEIGNCSTSSHSILLINPKRNKVWRFLRYPTVNYADSVTEQD